MLQPMRFLPYRRKSPYANRRYLGRNRTSQGKYQIHRFLRRKLVQQVFRRNFALGGEIFFIKDKRYKKAILELVDVIIEYILKPSKNPRCRFSTVSNGLYDPEWLLFPVIDKIKDAVGIQYVDMNFSYDFKYRFHSEERRKLCEDTINRFHDRYNYSCGVQMIITQDVVDMYLNGWRTTDLIDSRLPGNTLSFLYPHPINRGNNKTGAKISKDLTSREVRSLNS